MTTPPVRPSVPPVPPVPTTPTVVPGQRPTPGAPPVPRVPRAYARTKATRLLSAGAYLDPGYRKAVVRELLTKRFRVVAPSYGYDAVSVLAHALAARRLWRIQWGVSLGATIVLWVLRNTGTLNTLLSALLLMWVLWGTAYLRRLVTLQILMGRLKETRPDGGFDGAYPENGKLTKPLIDKIDSEQSADKGLVFYGSFVPFVGAGEPMRDWANAQLLLGEPKFQLAPGADLDRRTPEAVERHPVLPFTVHEITSYVAARMNADLRDEALRDHRIEGLTVEQRRYTTAIRTNDRTRGAGWTSLPGLDDLPQVHWREDYDSAREYLCVRVGSWNEELVTSIFVGFDLKGDTLHTEFYTYVLGPLLADFHLVDQLPDTFSTRLALKVAWDTVKFGPRSRPRSLREKRAGIWGTKKGKVIDNSEFRLGRYVNDSVDCGALTSVREMATSATYHHFFQKSDALKYTQIVERRLLHNIRSFLSEHHVDLADHDRAQTNILFGDNTQAVLGGHNENFGYHNHQAAGGSPSGNRGARSA